MRGLLNDDVLNKPPFKLRKCLRNPCYCLVLEWFDFTYDLQPNLLFFYVLFNQEERDFGRQEESFRILTEKRLKAFPDRGVVYHEGLIL